MRNIRKSAYGRTDLFLPSGSTVLREVKCMGGVARFERASVYHCITDAWKQPGVCCWHCCDTIESDAMPIPRSYDYVEKVFHVFGAVCSPECAKAFILSHATFDCGQHLDALTRMLHEVYGIDYPIVATPPQPALKRFGGPFAPTRRKVPCTILEPPFISYCMLAGEHLETEEEPENLDEPEPPALYGTYVQQRAAEAPRPKRPRGTPNTGPLSQFMKT
jgi:hypothetical protein